MKTLIRPIEDTDIERVSSLMEGVFRFAYRTAFSDEAGFEAYIRSSFQPARCAAELQKNCVACLVGAFGDEIAGVLKLATQSVPEEVRGSRPVELSKLYVHENWHGRGVAGRLMERALGIALDAGFDSMWLCVWEHNPRAQAFYRKHGFEVIGDMVIPVNGVSFRDLVMWRMVQRETRSQPDQVLCVRTPRSGAYACVITRR